MAVTERDRLVLDHVRRYRITTQRVLRELFCQGSEHAAKKLVDRLGEHLTADRLYGKTNYYRLTSATAAALGAPEEAARPLGAQAMPKAFGVLAFCCLNGPERWRYTRPDFGEDFPELVAALCGRRYYLDLYLDHDGVRPRLAEVHVDLGADVESVLGKCRKRLREALADRALRELVLEDGYAFAVVVAEQEKRLAIEDAVKRRPLRAPMRVEVVEELGRLPRSKDAGE